MANTSGRMLRLLSMLQTHRYWPGAELAERLEVSQRTLRRDVGRLRELGYPVRAQRGVDGGYQMSAGASLPPLVLDDEEAIALALGLQTAAQGAVEGIAESSVRALAKVIRVMPARLRRRVEALTAMTVRGAWTTPGSATHVDPGVLTTVALACQAAERIDFGYTAADGQESRRHVEPHRLVSLGQRWYLVCYDLGRHDWRSFRVDRIGSPLASGVRFRPRSLPAADAATFVRARMESKPARYDVAAIIHAPVSVAGPRVGTWCTVEPMDGGRSLLRVSTDWLDWAVMALGVAGAEFEVLSPPELIDMVRDWGGRFSRGTDG